MLKFFGKKTTPVRESTRLWLDLGDLGDPVDLAGSQSSGSDHGLGFAAHDSASEWRADGYVFHPSVHHLG